MTLEVESLRSEVEKYDREKMIEMVKQRAVQKDQEIASLYKELENLSLQVNSLKINYYKITLHR
jgi:predicted RNase H-like nuclease (RuvC/YqgF family)